ncbi:MAG TPA: glycosyltransferase family 39 protein [Chloroflexia bacterium]|nr:glycosyltransferase family 39 protein [Chloroflexia bacterium]
MTAGRRLLAGRDWTAWLLLAAVALLALLLLGKVVDSITTMLAFFNWPFQFDESEGMIVAETLLLDHGVNIYGPLTPAQFIAAPYPPLFYLLNWPVIHLAGPTFKAGRALSLLATAGAGGLIYLITLRLTRDALAGLLGALSWGAISLVTFWGALVKPDMLALACSLGGLWWILRTPAGGLGRLWAALPFLWAAFYSKQTAIAATVAVCVWLILREWRTGLLFTALFVAGAAGGYLALNGLTDGGYFYHEFTVHDLPWFPGRYLGRLADWATAYGLVILPGVLGVGLLLGHDAVALLRAAAGPGGALRRLGRWGTLAAPQGGLLVAGYLGMSLVTASGAGTLGGNHNHLLDLTAACCLGLALAVAAIRQVPGRAWRVSGALAVLVLCTQVPRLYDTPHWLGHELRVRTEITDGMRNIAQYTSNTPGLVYATDLSVLLATDKWQARLWTTDPYTQTHATLYHRWDEAALLQAIREQRFALVILPPVNLDSAEALGVLSPGLTAALRQAYQLDQRNVEYIYKPR